MIEVGHLLSALGAVILALGSVVWWLFRRMDTQVADERNSRERDKLGLRSEIDSVVTKLQLHELHVAREYVNHDHLREALKPLEAGMGRVEGTLTRLFDELKGKADKPGRAD